MKQDLRRARIEGRLRVWRRDDRRDCRNEDSILWTLEHTGCETRSGLDTVGNFAALLAGKNLPSVMPADWIVATLQMGENDDGAASHASMHGWSLRVKRVYGDPVEGPFAGVRRIRDQSILVVEDDFLQATEIISLLTDQGATVAGPVPSLERGYRACWDREGLDGAVLDIRLSTGWSFPWLTDCPHAVSRTSS